MANTKRVTMLVQITVTEKAVPAFHEANEVYTADGFYTERGWTDELVRKFSSCVPDDYTSEVEVLLLQEQR